MDQQRRRWANTLHSTVAQHLAALRLTLARLPTSAAREECIRLVEASAHDLQQVIAEIHPPVLDHFGLAAALRALAAERKTGLILDPEPPRLAPDLELAIYRLFESIEAETAVIQSGKNLRMIFPPVKLSAASRARARNLAARVRQDKAHVTITVPLIPDS